MGRRGENRNSEKKQKVLPEKDEETESHEEARTWSVDEQDEEARKLGQ
jgi:hypothetical protein